MTAHPFLLLFALLLLTRQALQAQLEPLAYYQMNGDARDASKYGNDGYIIGGVFPTEDRFGNDCGALQFNGSNGYITVPHSKSLGRPQKAYSISVWFKVLDGSEYSDLQWMTICCKSDIQLETPNSPQYRLQSTRYTVSMNTDFTENFDHEVEFDRWYFYTVTYDGQRCVVYLDDKELVSWPYQTRFFPNQYALEIGRDLPGQLEFFCGVMDELRIYDKALSPKEVRALYRDERERNSPKPCTNTPVTTIVRDSIVRDTIQQPCEQLPFFVNGDTIEYQQTVKIKHPNATLLFYDSEKEDGDIISVNFNGAWVVNKHTLKKRPKAQTVNLSLVADAENYLFTKAWNLGSIPPNTLTVEIMDPDGKEKPQVVKLVSEIGRSGAIKLIYEP